MKISNIHEAKSQLSKLIESALAGEEIIIAKAGKPLVRLIPYHEQIQSRKPGGWEGKVVMSDDFDDDLPPELLAGFIGKEAE
ncbi:type II toxin-antitoxin system Phd/YefM family antitoxin [Waterburya agarophytonicola K14]|uniref:Antitoxin n=1 Tax=Waterburya agarophytonicola KI4 TaxID=2874699 RepID=A0A964FDV4_9CYAN|nr:type II toxin-antitoxin system prevent-host-death family antitoxin [Waterburya agarophytonicola]MCC0176020.1 type II toxin-antitoxin system Phd/YefM family antitoxin [Waterburya agarophytonicola KI4]